MSGLGLARHRRTKELAYREWRRRQAVPFDIEAGITASVYEVLRSMGRKYYGELSIATNGFTHFEASYFADNPHYLPLLLHLSGLFSKSKLKEHVGSVSDRQISAPASERLVRLLTERVDPSNIVEGEILQRLESTCEGIVRDLVGRVLLESIVVAALDRGGLSFVRESDYEFLSGVVYNFRADFLLPDASAPKVFIEVRKSSARHASLYAKDKMFSAINWKGNSQDLLAVLVVDGPWTSETLRVMANVYDYVMPIGQVDDLVQILQAYLGGDRTVLKWLIDFRIASNDSE